MEDRAPQPGRRAIPRGRARECALLDELVSAIRQGESRSLVLRGEAGIGKTELLEYLIGAAPDLAVMRAVGVESDMELAYASLHQLCTPLLGRVESLPPPQREALHIVFGLSDGAPPDRFLVGLAVLGLLSDAAADRPILCVVDDAQWLDQASALTLAFVARRLLADAVGIVFGAREPGQELTRLPQLEVRGLGPADARALLASAAPFLLDERVREQIVAETRGNPLALLELPRGLTVSQLAGGFRLLEARALTGRIEESFVRRLEPLPEGTRLLLLAAAAEPSGDPLLLWRAAERLGLAPSATEPAEAGELLEIGARVTFRHPLVRSAAYGSAPAAQRRAVHLALAETTDPQMDPDRRAWHLGAAAAGPDEAVAAQLESSAARAQARGGLAAAAALLERSVALSADPARRTERALAAAQISLSAGAFDSALALMAVAESGALDELQRGKLELLQAQAAFAQRHGSDAPPLLLRAAKRLEALDPKLARETYLDAWSAALFAGRFAQACDLYEVSREVRRAQPATEPARPTDLLLDGFAVLLTDGRSSAMALLQQAVAGFAGDGASAEEVLRFGWLSTIAAVVVWDYERCFAAAARGVELARATGALTVLAVALNIMAQAEVLGGEYGRAARLITEADAVTEATGTQVLQYGALYLAAYQGREDDVAALADATIREATAGGQGNVLGFVGLARAALANGLGRHGDAVPPALDASDEMHELTIPMWALCELIEGAARSGQVELARNAIARLSERDDATANDWGRGIVARAQALVSEGEQAEGLYREAVERLARTRLRPELARAHLLYGEWLRREGRRADAREELRLAYDQLTSIGMEAFAERARLELAAAGENVRKPTVEARDQLTAQEEHIARLAGDGLSNAEIGARLFLSPRTVEWHLRKVFPKLGITSRRGLRGALAEPQADARPGL